MIRSNPADQIPFLTTRSVSFADRVAQAGYHPLKPAKDIRILQLNVGKWCNQACRHCHVDASPIRTETMPESVARRCMELAASIASIDTVDLTGGAPEGHAVFQYLVTESKRLGKKVIDRCNLTILSEPGFEWVAPFLADHEVEIVASLPHFSQARTDQQRGLGVFDRSVTGLKRLNELGYGRSPKHPLYLVYNPTGLFLAGNQGELEREYKTELKRRFDIEFTGLYALNNLPVSRFLDSLVRAGKLEDYMEVLTTSFNPGTIDGLMCRHQISVGYDGSVYDCDFNQMLELKVAVTPTVFDFDPDLFTQRTIMTYDHCYGCTAGAGSSCGGSIQ